MRVLQEIVKVAVQLLHTCELRGLLVKTRKLIDWKCVPPLASYCCDIPEAEDMSAMCHGVVVKRLCGRCMVTAEDFIGGKIAGEKVGGGANND